ncbi:unnamed protein product [Boreogadus saida]
MGKDSRPSQRDLKTSCREGLTFAKLSHWRTAIFFFSLFLCLTIVFAFSFVIPCPVRPQYLSTWNRTFYKADVCPMEAGLILQRSSIHLQPRRTTPGVTKTTQARRKYSGKVLFQVDRYCGRTGQGMTKEKAKTMVRHRNREKKKMAVRQWESLAKVKPSLQLVFRSLWEAVSLYP